MNNFKIGFMLLVSAMLFSTGFAFAVEPLKSADTDPSRIKAGVKSTSDVANAKTTVKSKIDINTASEAELISVPGIGTAYASKIIAARPYANKAQLKSRNVLPVSVYEQVKEMIIARQPAKEAPGKNRR